MKHIPLDPATLSRSAAVAVVLAYLTVATLLTVLAFAVQA